MLARRHDNENAIYEQQQAAASKPLNQGVKGLAPKTPANKPPKTPFGKNRNDENATLIFGKGGMKDGKPEKNAFLTPANPGARAPLGNKTTNAKAFKTPAPILVPEKGNDNEKPSSAKPTSPRLRRSKIKVHESTSVQDDILSKDPEEREIEYMPPREVPLPDYPDELWPHDRTYPQFEGANFTKGWWSEYAPSKNKSEDDPELSDYEENLRKADEREKKEAEAKKAKPTPLASRSRPALATRPAPTIKKSQDAASALASRPVKSGTPSFAAPPAAMKARQPVSTAAKKPIFDKGNPRFTAAKAASNSTIGYSKGRVVSANRRPLADIHTRPQSSKGTEPSENKNTLNNLLGLGSLDIADEDADLGFSGSKGALDLLDGDDELEVFQLDPVQDL